jgi:hypothetical protein
LTEVDAAAIVLRRPSFHELMDIEQAVLWKLSLAFP